MNNAGPELFAAPIGPSPSEVSGEVKYPFAAQKRDDATIYNV